jgi:DNA-directed RNA polymerase subunit RPC12/RpoP
MSEIKIKALRSSYSSAPLEPPRELGDTILYDPYSGSFEALTTETGRQVTPRFSEADTSAQSISNRYVSGAVRSASGNTFAALQHATSQLESAVRGMESSHHMYPEAALHKNPRYVELREAYNYAQNMLDSAKSTSPQEGGNYFVEQGLKQIRDLKTGYLKHMPKTIRCPKCGTRLRTRARQKCSNCGITILVKNRTRTKPMNIRHLK